MFRPQHQPRVEKQNLLLSSYVKDTLSVRLPTVAMKASERQVIQSVLASRQDVVNRERDELPILVCVAVLAE